MKLTIDCVLTSELSALQSDSALARLLSKAKVTQLDMPLEALICEQYGLPAAVDYPIAAISAAADGLNVGDAFWLRADPVHLLLQRDCFSLGEPVPLPVKREHAESMLASLNQHFNQDGITFFSGQSGAWYLRAGQGASQGAWQIPQIKTTLPSVAARKNIHQFLPQGLEAARWVAVMNEVQMLLHEHPANEARELAGEAAVNSIWLSGGGVMPLPVKSKAANFSTDVSLMVADSVLYQGLALWADAPCQALPTSFDSVLQNSVQHVRLQLPPIDNLDEAWLSPIFTALKNKKIKQLTLNSGFYEKSLTAEIRPVDTYKFWLSPIWRKPKPVASFLQ